ncbi:glutathione S-transferase [Aureimonas populi]|uniref:Glutathione S-transferase n=1 Tax=Aureimonas populi TaxID=1701758 RepID=A0ABW5CMV2_9HYPH|nr:glutathione S-transferase [Aureimonas populi]
MAEGALRIEGAANEAYPWSGKPILAGMPTLYRQAVVGICNSGCRKFEKAAHHLEAALSRQATRG